ncbi:MAG: hypothetical protein JSS20_20555 [Proteobacteria bacterium]|nr:hypothetical protein [Pseudomonadota bacterium]
MKPRNARLLDDLFNNKPGGALYKHVRDGHSSDLAEIVTELERLMPEGPTQEALVAYTWLLIEARGEYGSDEARKRDAERDKRLAELQAGAKTSSTQTNRRRTR